MNKETLIKEIEKVYQHRSPFKGLIKAYNKIIILGNGGSNAIASHICQDYTKQLGKKAFTFSDASRLTCYINDYGIENAYAQFLHEFADPSDTLIILISSSGNSANMLNAMEYCVYENFNYIILTGFNEHNKMQTLNQTASNPAKLNIWINSNDYGIVENTHQIFLHSILGE